MGRRLNGAICGRLVIDDRVLHARSLLREPRGRRPVQSISPEELRDEVPGTSRHGDCTGETAVREQSKNTDGRKRPLSRRAARPAEEIDLPAVPDEDDGGKR